MVKVLVDQDKEAILQEAFKEVAPKIVDMIVEGSKKERAQRENQYATLRLRFIEEEELKYRKEHPGIEKEYKEWYAIRAKIKFKAEAKAKRIIYWNWRYDFPINKTDIMQKFNNSSFTPVRKPSSARYCFYIYADKPKGTSEAWIDSYFTKYIS